jgi:hypothetical protein
LGESDDVGHCSRSEGELLAKVKIPIFGGIQIPWNIFGSNFQYRGLNQPRVRKVFQQEGHDSNSDKDD